MDAKHTYTPSKAKLYYSLIHGVAKKAHIIHTHTCINTQRAVCIYIYLFIHTYSMCIYIQLHINTRKSTHTILIRGCAHRDTTGKKIPLWTVMLWSSQSYCIWWARQLIHHMPTKQLSYNQLVFFTSACFHVVLVQFILFKVMLKDGVFSISHFQEMYFDALIVVLKLFCFKTVRKLITHNTYNTHV